MEEETCACPDRAFIIAMIAYIAQTDSFFGERQRDSDSPSQEDKEQFVHSVLHRSPSTFIASYGDKLTQTHLDYFTSNLSDDDNLIYQLTMLEKNVRDAGQRVKNRRFTAMKSLLVAEDYFCDEQMKHRDPLLYEQMVGQYLTEEEIKTQSDNLLRQHTGISTILLEQMDSKGNSQLYDRQLSKQECQYEEEEDSDGDVSMDEEENNGGNKAVSLPADERLALREEFLHIMQERFLSGQDTEFDYALVDDNNKYDDIVQESRDAEDQYFDDTDEDETRPEEPSSLAPDEYDY